MLSPGHDNCGCSGVILAQRSPLHSVSVAAAYLQSQRIKQGRQGTSPDFNIISTRPSALKNHKPSIIVPDPLRTQLSALTMATPNVQNLKEQNAAYASGFTQGHLALPPAKKYLVGKPEPIHPDPLA